MNTAWLVSVLLAQTGFLAPQGWVELEPSPDVVAVRAERGPIEAWLAERGESARVSSRRGITVIERLRQPHGVEKALAASGVELVDASRIVGTNTWVVLDDEVLVRFRDGVDVDEAEKLVRALGATLGRSLHAGLNLYVAHAQGRDASLELALRLHALPQTRWAEPHLLRRLEKQWSPNDPYLSQQAYLDTVTAKTAWDTQKGASGTVIAVIDSGVDAAHPDLAAKLVAGYDFTDDDTTPNPGTGANDYHGTACAGLAAAATNNGVGIAGMCPSCTIMPLRLTADSTVGSSDLAVALLWAVDHGAAVASISLGYPGDTQIAFVDDDAIRYAASHGRGGKGTVVVIASGNAGASLAGTPFQFHPLAISVGAVNASGVRESYSNYGAGLDLVAPVGNPSTDLSGAANIPGDYLQGLQGTSFSAPIVSGAAALLVAAHSAWTAAQVRYALVNSAAKVGGVAYSAGFHPQYGYGRLDTQAALQLGAAVAMCSPTVELCTSGVDEDCDGLVDGADYDCLPVQGEPCAAASTCADDLLCVDIPGPTSAAKCLPVCRTSTECAIGELCSIVEPPLGICIARGSPECPACGTLSCPTNAECLYGDAFAMCSPLCATSADCPLAYACVDVGAGTKACLPLSGSCNTTGPSVGASCTATNACREGAMCMQRAGVMRCEAVCRTTADCTQGTTCSMLSSAPGRGTCVCACDVTAASCDAGCACDATCSGACACDVTAAACDVGCACDASCPASCDCDLSAACDPDCDSCDPECQGEAPGTTPKKKGGCAATEGRAGALAALLFLAFSRRFTRRVR